MIYLENFKNFRIHFSDYNENEKKIIKAFLYLYYAHQGNHHGSFDYNRLVKIYYMLPEDFRSMIKYTSRKILYRGQEIGSKIEDQIIATFTKSENMAKFFGDEIITNKQYKYKDSIDTEKLVKFIINRKNKEIEDYEIGDDEAEVMLIK